MNTFTRIALSFLLLPCLSVAASAEPLTATMVDYGVYSIHRGEMTSNEGVAGGLIESYGKKLLQTTDVVEAKLGTNFGFRYLLKGSGKHASVTIRVMHPAPLRDPASGKTFATSEWSQEVPIGQVNWNTGWVFESPWELVPDEWVMQLYAENRLLLEKRFHIRVVKEKK
jgi:hypothetical protein